MAQLQGRVATDSVMLTNQLRKDTGGTVYGKDIKLAFNSVGRAEIFKDSPELAAWIDTFLKPRSLNIRIDGRKIGSTTMTGGTP